MELFKDTKLKYLIVAYDAGAAYQIYYVIKKFKIKTKYFLQGPARKILNKKNIESLDAEIKKSDIIITGTSLKSNLEIKVIKKCLKLKKKIISIVDNYNNFKKRFLFEKKIYFPNTIITFDSLSYIEAKKYKKKFYRLIKSKDYYLEYIKKIPKKLSKKKIIYISSNWNRVTSKPIDVRLAEYFCIKLEKLKLLKPNDKIFLKTHPSEKKNKYLKSKILKKFKLQIEKNLDMINILKNYTIVGGCETYALALAKVYGLKTYNNIKNFNFKGTLGNLYGIESI